jgi:hypothetical protein
MGDSAVVNVSVLVLTAVTSSPGRGPGHRPGLAPQSESVGRSPRFNEVLIFKNGQQEGL